MGYALKQIDLEETSCCSCGTVFCVDRVIMDNRRKNAGNIYCPNGHCIGWSETEADRLRKQLEQQKQRAEMEAASRRTAEEGRGKAEKELKRLKTRVNAGVCPCCNRTFQNLARHMETKHKGL